MEGHEDVFAEEAQEEIQDRENLRRRQEPLGSSKHVSIENASDRASESSPLIGNTESIRGPRAQHKRGYSYQRAINEPWTGAHGQGGHP